jgi:hypothetical protein
MIFALRGLDSYSSRLDRVVSANCKQIEALKAVQVKAANATIDGDLAFLKAHPDGTADFPRSVVLADITAKQEVVNKFAANPCP